MNGIMTSLRLGKATQPILWILLCIFSGLLSVFLYTKLPFINHSKPQQADWVPVTSQASLIHVGSNDSFAITQDGIQAGRTVLDFLENKNPDSAKIAIQIYKRIIPIENYGGEYSALQWFCEILLAPEAERQKAFSNKFNKAFYDFFAENNFANLKEYLKRKYKLAEIGDETTQKGQDRNAFLEDFILFNNPKREEWEKTSEIIRSIDLKPAEKVADIGSGPGYYTFQFAKLVGDQGRVYAIDLVQEHLNRVEKFAKDNNIQNVETINSTPGNTIGAVPDGQIDMAFMCSLYHNVYAMSKEVDRASFVESIKKALKPNGRLVVVDNALVDASQVPYHGPYIAKELVVSQFKYHGLRLVSESAPIPQRYILIFKKA